MNTRTPNIRIVTTDGAGRFYYVDDISEPFPSVTTVISAIYGKPFPDSAAHYAYLAAERGTEVHRACHLLVGGNPGYELDWDSLDELVRPRVEGFAKFLSMHTWKPIASEQPVVSMLYRYGGTLDQAGHLDGRMSLIDFKPRQALTAPLQTAAYLLAWREQTGNWEPCRRYALHLDPTLPNGFRLNRHESISDKNIFLAMLDCYRWGIKNLKDWPPPS